MTTEYSVKTPWGDKHIGLFTGELSQLPEPVDLLVCSAFWRDYLPTRTSLIGALQRDFGVSVAALSAEPELDLKDLGVWVSQAVDKPLFGRIACVEMRHTPGKAITQDELRGLYDTLFFALRKCRQRGIPVRSVAMHILGTGNQDIPLETSLIPLLAESVAALNSEAALERIVFFDRRVERGIAINECLRRVATGMRTGMAFISYSHADQDIANRIANGLEENGVKPWIDHRMIRNPDYAREIMEGMSQSRAFLLLVSESSMASYDVQRELCNAVGFAAQKRLLIMPVLLQKVKYTDDFAYHLTGLNWEDLSSPPIEEKTKALCEKVSRVIQ